MNRQLLVLLATATFGTAATAGGACMPQTTRGDWMYTCEGLLPAPALTSTRILGTCSASKSAFWTCSGTVNLGGLIIPQGLTGQASNQPDCTGAISYTQTLGGSPAGQLDINFVIFDGGDAISGLPTNSNGVLSCSLRRIGKGSN